MIRSDRWNEISGVFCLMAFALTYACKPAVSTDADAIIFNARIYTVTKDKPWAEAIAIRAGRILAVGSEADIKAFQGPQTEILDAQGRFVMPGFIEGHGHFPGLGSSLQSLNLLRSENWQEIIDAVAAKVVESRPGEWITGRGWHQEKWSEPPGHHVLGYPYHHDLSRISPENPVMLTHASGHALFANEAAMRIAAVSRETPDPSGGHIVRGDGGEAIGIFEENAQYIIREAYQDYLATLTAEDIEAQWYHGIALAQEECLKKGVTSFQDAGTSLMDIRRLEEMAGRGELDVRLWMMIRHTHEYLHDKLDGFPKTGIGDGFFTCRAVKVSIDGALGSFGAWLLEPYQDKPGFTGQNTTSLEELEKLAILCADHGLQLCTHAIGDRANREALDVYERIFRRYGDTDDWRWRIEHAQHLHPDDIARFRNLAVIASMQGIHCTSDAPFVIRRLGEERARTGAYVWRSLLDSGAVVTNGTDAPVEDLDPIESFYASVTRTRADDGTTFFREQAMTRAEAIYSYTMANAFAAFEEHEKGSLEVGKFADLILLSNNLMECAKEEIMNTRVLLTMVGGQVKYRSPDF